MPSCTSFNPNGKFFIMSSAVTTIQGNVAAVYPAIGTKDGRQGLRFRVGCGRNVFMDIITWDREQRDNPANPDYVKNHASYLALFMGKGTRVTVTGNLVGKRVNNNDGWGSEPQYRGNELQATSLVQLGLHSGEQAIINAIRRNMTEPSIAEALEWITTNIETTQGNPVKIPASWEMLNEREVSAYETIDDDGDGYCDDDDVGDDDDVTGDDSEETSSPF